MAEAVRRDDALRIRADDVGAARSLVGRFSGAVALVALIAVAILFAVTYSVTSSGLTRVLAAGVDADLAGLVDIYATSGRDELIARIDDRHALTARDGRQPHYLLLENGRAVGGDQRRWPALSAAQSARGYVTLDDGRPAYARAVKLGPGLDLMVARENGPERATLARLAVGFAATAAAIVLAVFVLAWLRSRALARRLARINSAYARADAESVAALIADPATDEIGELSRRSGRALERQRRLVESQRHVTDHIAHELRTPLMHLDGRLRAMLKDRPEAGETLALASSDIRGITRMLDALLDIAASQAERGDRSGLAGFDLSELADDLAEIYRASMEEAGLTLLTAIAPGVGMTGDPTQISRMLANLLDNAIKYVPAGGTVRLEVAAGPRITVADDGPGIAADLAPRVFERFRRGTQAPDAPGHGLGLSLARAIAERHDLSLNLVRGGRGARFVIAPDEAGRIDGDVDGDGGGA